MNETYTNSVNEPLDKAALDKAFYFIKESLKDTGERIAAIVVSEAMYEILDKECVKQKCIRMTDLTGGIKVIKRTLLPGCPEILYLNSKGQLLIQDKGKMIAVCGDSAWSYIFDKQEEELNERKITKVICRNRNLWRSCEGS